jgi:hypothetical protein
MGIKGLQIRGDEGLKIFGRLSSKVKLKFWRKLIRPCRSAGFIDVRGFAVSASPNYRLDIF